MKSGRRMKSGSRMSVRLLDVNILVSLMDSAQVHHAPSVRWFRETAVPNGWSTCAVTEMGFVRTLSSHAYPNRRLIPHPRLKCSAVFAKTSPKSAVFGQTNSAPATCISQRSPVPGKLPKPGPPPLPSPGR